MIINKGELVMKRLHVLSAGVAATAAKDTTSKWNAANPDFPAILDCGSSVDLINRVLCGEPCDILILADYIIIEKLMMPKYADGYYIFAGNSMVLRAAEGNDINDNNWAETLLNPKTIFTHNDPFGDPGGYRAVMTMKLADTYEPGLSAKLFDHPGYIGLELNKNENDKPPYNYMFYYYTGALASGLPFANLPATMNLSDESLSDIYAKASFKIDDKNTIIGTPICHAVTIPCNSQYPTQAREFTDMFLQYDFEEKGFLPRRGNTNITLPK